MIFRFKTSRDNLIRIDLDPNSYIKEIKVLLAEAIGYSPELFVLVTDHQIIREDIQLKNALEDLSAPISFVLLSELQKESPKLVERLQATAPKQKESFTKHPFSGATASKCHFLPSSTTLVTSSYHWKASQLPPFLHMLCHHHQLQNLQSVVQKFPESLQIILDFILSSVPALAKEISQYQNAFLSMLIDGIEMDETECEISKFINQTVSKKKQEVPIIHEPQSRSIFTMEEEAKIRWMKEKTGLSTIKCAQAFFNLKASKQSLKEWVANNSQRDNEASSSDKPSTAPTSDQSEDFESTPQTQPQTQHKTQSQSQSQSQPQTLTSISTIHNTSQKEAPKQPAQIRNECLKITIKDELKIREIKKETDTSLSLATQYYLQNDRNKDKAIESIMKKKDEPTKYVLSDNT